MKTSLLACCGFLCAFSASAQTGKSDAGAEAGATADRQIETVIVIGEKVARPYLETFTSVGVVRAEDFINFDLGDTSDAFNRLANVRAFAQGAGSNSVSIRGMNADGITQPANSAALISVVIDGVTQSAEGLKRGSRGVWDVQQLEVHRGPQSTTQGRNALAGTVIIKSRDPTFEPEVRLRATAGELDRREAALALSGPIIEDQLAVRLSGEYRERTTDINFADPGNEPLAEDEFYNIRGKALYQPKGLPGFEGLLTINHVFDSPSSAPVSGPDFFERNFAADSIFTEFREMTADNYSLDLGYEISDGVTLRAVSAFTDTDLEISSAPSSTAFFRRDNRQDGDFTQEFRLEIDRPMAGFTGVAGIFYGGFEQETDSFIAFNGITVQDGVVENETETWAAYADLRYALSDRTTLIVGGRLQDDTVSVSVGDDFSVGAGIDESTEDTEFLPRLGLSFAPSEDQTVTASVNRGYRQGFTERRVTSAGTTIAAVDPEFLWAYEVAYRHELFSDRLLLGINVFYNDYEDQQITVSDNAIGLFPATLNAGESESYGLELEAQYDNGRGFSAYAALGLLETEIGTFTDTNCEGGTCEGNAYSEAPEVTASIGGSYFHASGLYGSLAISYTDDFFQSINNADDIRVEGYTLVDCKIGYRYGGARISLYANNVFDEDYLLGLVSENEGSVGDGREVGVEILAEF